MNQNEIIKIKNIIENWKKIKEIQGHNLATCDIFDVVECPFFYDNFIIEDLGNFRIARPKPKDVQIHGITFYFINNESIII